MHMAVITQQWIYTVLWYCVTTILWRLHFQIFHLKWNITEITETNAPLPLFFHSSITLSTYWSCLHSSALHGPCISSWYYWLMIENWCMMGIYQRTCDKQKPSTEPLKARKMFLHGTTRPFHIHGDSQEVLALHGTMWHKHFILLLCESLCIFHDSPQQ